MYDIIREPCFNKHNTSEIPDILLLKQAVEEYLNKEFQYNAQDVTKLVNLIDEKSTINIDDEKIKEKQEQLIREIQNI